MSDPSKELISSQNIRICVIGLGYVGLPLSVEFSKHFSVLGFDKNSDRVKSLRSGVDSTSEISPDELAAASQLNFTDKLKQIAACNVFIVTVPTPIDEFKRPDLTPLLAASDSVGKVLKPGDVVIYESTVYPGATEDDCVPVLEQKSGLRFNTDFFVGYSPERINPGDKKNRLPNIVKVTSGSNEKTADFVDCLYKKIIQAGTHRAQSIKVAEAAKVIENTQRDVNIALVNELSIIFNKLNIDSQEVLAAAGTKWNFLPFSPGLVGGHCIGVDPYYLTHKAESLGYNPEIILSGRRLNDFMSIYVVRNLLKVMARKQVPIGGSRVLVMGLSFKENCPDIRNSKVADIVQELKDYDVNVDIFDPWVDKEQARSEYGFILVDELVARAYDAVVITVAHSAFKEIGYEGIQSLLRSRSESVIYDLKAILAKDQSDLRL